MTAPLSRRNLLLGRLRRAGASVRHPDAAAAGRPAPRRGPVPPAAAQAPPAQGADVRAVIMGRFCLAYQHVTCTTCYERCPEPGAIVRDARGLPRVVADACTGCRVCHDVCPAPTNAVLLTAPPPGTRTP